MKIVCDCGAITNIIQTKDRLDETDGNIDIFISYMGETIWLECKECGKRYIL